MKIHDLSIRYIGLTELSERFPEEYREEFLSMMSHNFTWGDNDYSLIKGFRILPMIPSEYEYCISDLNLRNLYILLEG